MSLKQKTITGLSWSFIDNFLARSISVAIYIVLANLLPPTEFGIVGLVTFFIAISGSFVDSGFASFLIKEKDCTTVDCNTVFYFNVFVAIFLYLLLFCSAPFIEYFYNKPGLTSIMRVVCLVLIINAVGAIQNTLLIKKVDFKTRTKVSIISDTLSGGIAIFLAYKGFGVWSLVWKSVLGQSFTTILLWVLNSWRPAAVFSFKRFKEMFGFGYKLALSGLIDNAYKNIYYPIIGKCFSFDTLAFYTQSERFTDLLASTLTFNIQRVSFPVLSSIQDDPKKLRTGYQKMIKSTMMITFSLMLGLAAIAKPLIIILIGEEWLPCVPYIQIMCLYSMLNPLHAMNLNIIVVKGRSDWFLKLEIIKKIILVPLIFVVIYLGIEALLIGTFVTSIISYFLNSYYSARLINYSSKAQLVDIMPLFAVAFIVSSFVWCITLLGWNNWITIILQMGFGILLTVGIYEIIGQPNYQEMKDVVIDMKSKILRSRKTTK